MAPAPKPLRRAVAAISLLVLAIALPARAARAGPVWYGLVPSKGGARALSLVTLTDDAGIESTLGDVPLGADERAWPDGFRCLRGFCAFPTTTYKPPSPLPLFSTVYNVSAADARVVSKARCGTGFCRDMHLDFRSGDALVLSVEEQSTTVLRFAGGVATAVADVTAAVGNGDIDVGQTTHCSEVGAGGHFYVGVDFFGEGSDYILSVDIAGRKIDNRTVLEKGVEVPDALWAKCDGSGVIGGVSFAPGKAGANGTATFVTIDARGRAAKGDAVGVPGDSVPNGMLTAAADSSHYLAAFYPQTTPVNATDAKGWLWAVAPFGGSDDFVSRIDTYLVGAAFDAAAAQR